MQCVILPYQVAGGAANMALDAALLEHAPAAPGTVFVRTYGWVVPTLSLGYFQRLAEATEGGRWAGLPLVRRPTGGGAILHHHELTYAVVLPANHPAARPVAALYRTVHAAIQGLLREQGLEANRRGEGARAGGEVRRPFLCFTDRDPEDLVCAGRKVVGSAQRKSKGAILQHGSLLLGRSGHAPELPGISDLGGPDRAIADWSGLVARTIAASLGLEPSGADFPAGLEQRAGALERLVYRDPGWTGRR